jgi:hypothetical protein
MLATCSGRKAPYFCKGHTACNRWTTAKRNCQSQENEMLWTIFVVLLILWLLGFVGFHVLGAYIHILLVIALVVLLIQLITGRRAI